MCSSPVRHWLPYGSPFDLHVLGTPPAFILSQDQTLHLFFDEKPLSALFFISFLSDAFLLSFQCSVSSPPRGLPVYIIRYSLSWQVLF